MPAWRELLVEHHEAQRKLLADPAYQKDPNGPARAESVSLASLRQNYLAKLGTLRKRNAIAYYSGFQSGSAQPGGTVNEGFAIRDVDRDGFMSAIHKLDRGKGLDLILHTPGGGIAATQALVRYLMEAFQGDMVTIVPHTAMSAGTLIALASKKLYMASHSSIGPIDPQVRGVPAKGVMEEIETAHAEMKKDLSKELIWKHILSKYTPTFLGECKHAIAWSEEFAKEALLQGMLGSVKKRSEATVKANAIVKKLTSYGENKSHSRQIGHKEASEIGLAVERLEHDNLFQDAVLSVHHLFVHTFNNTPAYKIIASTNGSEFVQATR